MEIGRKVYYEKTVGTVLLVTSEMSGDVFQTTVAQDFTTYAELNGKDPATVGVIELAYGAYPGKFGVYHFTIDTVTPAIIWGSLITPLP